MKQIDYFFKESDYYVLGTINNPKAEAFVENNGTYKRLHYISHPYVLKVHGLYKVDSNFPSNSSRINWVLPVVVNQDGSFTEIPYADYCNIKSSGASIDYLRISAPDRLKLHSWIKLRKNFRFHVYQYENLNLICFMDSSNNKQVKKESLTFV